MNTKKVLVAGFMAAVVVVAALLGNIVLSSSPTPRPLPHPNSPDDGIAAIRLSLPLFHRVDSQYTRGSEPAHGGVEMLTKLGVRCVVDLRSSYDRTDEIRIAAERAGLSYYSLPLSVWEPPDDAQVSEFMSLVGDASKGPFFVFCTDGLHRTGEMTAIYRIVRHNWDIRRALAEMDEIGFNPYYYSMRNYVWSYARRFRPGSVTKDSSRPQANPNSSSERRPPGVGG